MNKQLFTAIEVALIAGLIVAVLYWGGVFEPKPVPSPTTFPLPTIAIRTPTPEPTTTPPAETPSPTPLPTFAAPTLVEPSGLIAFNALDGLTHEIYTINVGEGLPSNTPRNLTNNPADDYLLSWSPDGTRIAFFSTRTDWLELYVMDADGSNVVQLTDYKAEIFGGVQTAYVQPVSWSPDGAYLLAARTNAWSIRQALQITLIDRVFTDGSGIENVYSSSETIEGVRLSPDGQYVAMVTIGTEGYGVYKALVSEDGLNELEFVKWCEQFNWVPNTHTLACGFGGVVSMIDEDGERKTPGLYNSHSPHSEISWAPNGRLFFVQAAPEFLPDGFLDIALFENVSSSDEPRFVEIDRTSTYTGSDWSWSPDNQWVAFTSDRFGPENISVVNIYNPDDVRQLNLFGRSFAPQWQP